MLFAFISYHHLVEYLYGPIDHIILKLSPLHNVELEEDTKDIGFCPFQWEETKGGGQRCGEDWEGESRFGSHLWKQIYILPTQDIDHLSPQILTTSNIDHRKQRPPQISTTSDIDHLTLTTSNIDHHRYRPSQMFTTSNIDHLEYLLHQTLHCVETANLFAY